MSNSRVFASIDAVINPRIKRGQSLPKGVQTVVIGDVRDIRQDNDIGHTNNQKVQCVVSAPVELPTMGRRLRVDNLLGYRPYLAGKPKGESSMVGKRLSTKICRAKRRQSCVHGET
jgi:hypothetical protein